jgi:hypothetical protein
MKIINSFKKNLATIAILLTVLHSSAKENVTGSNNPLPHQTFSKVTAGCSGTTSQTDIDVNNVRARIQVGGDMWWDFINAKYEIPINSGKTCIYAGCLWIGGVDASGNIKVAAQTYRQTGVDFFAGPVDSSSVFPTISTQKCKDYNRIWKVTKQEVQDFVGGGSATQDITEWPGNGNLNGSPHEGHFLAPFIDVDGDGVYNAAAGDYPGYNFTGNYPDAGLGVPKTICNDYIFGDKTLWWVFNDVGDIHSETGSPNQLGMEVRAQAFGFKTNDAINDMTFYKYQVINRSSTAIDSTYFGQWCDPDLGDATDDFVGCDVIRGLGYCYNGDPNDGTAAGYGDDPPSVGIDFFQGPVADLHDGLDNDRDGCIDCTYLIDQITGDTTVVSDSLLGEQIIMSKFLKLNNDQTPVGNPQLYTEYYNFLRGICLDGSSISYGGVGYGGTIPTNYMFPGTTDPDHPGLWSESSAGIPPNDRRFLQSAGPFTLQPGAVNYITTGVVWARAIGAGVDGGIAKMLLADDKAQALFNNCFKLVDGPNAPDVAIRELDKEIILTLINTDTNVVELYNVVDPVIPASLPDSLRRFKFQGYKIYQLKDATTSLKDPINSLADQTNNEQNTKLVAEYDIKDGISQIINFSFDPNLNSSVPFEEVKGADAGLSHTIRITTDLFTGGALINHKTYFYTVISFAYNNYEKYDPLFDSTFGGQTKPYLVGRNNIKTYSAIPHIPTVEGNGQVLNSGFGDGPEITRVEGQGNGGLVLDFTSASENEILTSSAHRSYHPVYTAGHGPIDVKVYDPTLVGNLNFEVRFNGIVDTSRWSIEELTKSLTVQADFPLSQTNEQVLAANSKEAYNDPNFNWGLTLSAHKVIEAGKVGAVKNAFLEGTMTFSDNTKRWLTGLQNVTDTSLHAQNWIRSTAALGDPDLVYEDVIGGTWAPMRLTSNDPLAGPKPGSTGITDAQILLSPNLPEYGASQKTGIASINLVITSDQSKWTRSAVIELGEDTAKTIGAAFKFNLRKSPSFNIGGDNSISDSSMGWFPGYAYNLETGERLNIAYGENSSLRTITTGNDNAICQDMQWNPSSTTFLKNSNGLDSLTEPVLGGMHYIYIFGHNADNPANDVPKYDSCKYIFHSLDSAAKNPGPSTSLRRNVWKDAMWVNIPLAVSGKTLLSSDVQIRLRVAKTYRRYATTPTIKNNQPLVIGQTYYVVSPDVTHNGTTYDTSDVGTSFVAVTTFFAGNGTVTTQAPVNGFNPMYSFGTGNLAPVKNNLETAKSALDLINVVPNPYYAYSAYEGTTSEQTQGQLDNRIRIVNLPPLCTISIFTINGTLIRRFERAAGADNSAGGDTQKGNTEASIDWDLKNSKGIAIASGIYLIHVEAPGLGQRTLKWFGMLRPIDLSTF